MHRAGVTSAPIRVDPSIFMRNLSGREHACLCSAGPLPRTGRDTIGLAGRPQGWRLAKRPPTDRYTTDPAGQQPPLALNEPRGTLGPWTALRGGTRDFQQPRMPPNSRRPAVDR